MVLLLLICQILLCFTLQILTLISEFDQSRLEGALESFSWCGFGIGWRFIVRVFFLLSYTLAWAVIEEISSATEEAICHWQYHVGMWNYSTCTMYSTMISHRDPIRTCTHLLKSMNEKICVFNDNIIVLFEGHGLLWQSFIFTLCLPWSV